MSSQSRSRARPVSRSAGAPATVEHPGKISNDPARTLADPDLSKRDKIHALNAMEQDARQLAVAAAEGMGGGEETNLRNVLQAKRILETPKPDAAFRVVRQTFEAELQNTLGTDTHDVIMRALDAIKAARQAIARRARTPAPPPGAPAPGSPQELEEELAKEKLDP